jgi:hypothetical protein
VGVANLCRERERAKEQHAVRGEEMPMLHLRWCPGSLDLSPVNPMCTPRA